MAAVKDPYQALGVDKKASDEEIKKAYRKLAREYHPDTQPGRLRRRGPLQGDPGGLLDPVRPGEAARVRLRRRDLRRRLRPGRVPRRLRRRRSATSSPTSSAAARGAGGAGAAAAARARPRDRGAHLLRAVDGGRAGAGQRRRCRLPARPATAPAPSPAPRRPSAAACNGRGVEAESQGLFSISQPCHKCGGTRHRDQGPLPDLQRQRPDAPGQALPGEHPGRRAQRQPRAPGRQGRGRAARRPARRPVRGHARRRLADLPAQGRQPRGRGADHDRGGDSRRHHRGADPERHEADPRPSGHPARHDPAAARARGRRGWAAAGAATSTTGS